MSDQDMQFADPDWKPTSSLAGNSAAQNKQGRQDSSSQAAYVPRPVNDEWREQSPLVDERERSDLPPYAGYAGSMPAQQPPEQYQRQQMPYYRRRRRGPWLWIILIILLVSLVSGGFSSIASIGQKDAIQNQTFANFSGTPTVVIHETSGDIHVQQGATSQVQIQADKRTGFFDDPNNIQVKFNQDGNTINVNVDTGVGFLSDRNVDFTVTVPQDVNLQLQTDSGDINVDNIQGQANLNASSGDITANNDQFSTGSSLQTVSGDVNTQGDTFGDNTAIGTTSGDIKLNNDTLQGSEKFNTTSGNINFDGTVDSSGHYQFNAVSGDINIDLLQTVSFSVDAQTTSGSIHADDFPAIQVNDNNSGSGSNASGTVGSPPSAQFTLRTTSGDITLHQN